MSEIRELILIWDRLVQAVEKATVDNAGLKKVLGEKAKNLIFKRTKTGFGVKSKNETPLEPLSPSYIRQRRVLQKQGKLSSSTNPNLSNATKTGNMLNDLTSDITDNGAIVSVNDAENRLKLKNYNKGEVMNLTNEERESLARTITASIVLELRKFK